VAGTAVLLFAVPYGLVYAGETQVSAGLAAVLWSTIALFAALYASRILPDEPLTPFRLVGIGAGICGLVLVFHGALGLRDGHLAVLAMFGLLAAPASGAYGRVIVRRDGPTLPQTVLLAWSMGLAGLALLAVGVIAEPFHVTPDARTLGSIAYLSFVGSVVPFMLLYWLLGKVRAVSAVLIDLALPLVTLLAGWAFYGEAVSGAVVAGAVVVVGGLALATADARRVHA
jgi:drug/metabolite transporter (DMT)-like permease